MTIFLYCLAYYFTSRFFTIIVGVLTNDKSIFWNNGKEPPLFNFIICPLSGEVVLVIAVFLVLGFPFKYFAKALERAKSNYQLKTIREEAMQNKKTELLLEEERYAEALLDKELKQLQAKTRAIQ